MEKNAIKNNENNLLNVFKYIAALLVLGSHCLPLVQNNTINFYYGQWFFRFCVPLFFISSGYFFASFKNNKKIEQIIRIAVLYLLSSFIYLPLYFKLDKSKIIEKLIFGHHHLWYLSAMVFALVILFIIENIPFINKVFAKIYPLLAIVLIIIGAYYDEYHRILGGLKSNSFLKGLGTFIENTGGHRHALFFAIPMLLIGKFLYEHKDSIKLSKLVCILLILFSFAGSLIECICIKHFIGYKITCDITLLNYLPAVFLIILTFVWQPEFLKNIETKHLRKNADIIYIIHALVLAVVDNVFEVTYLSRLFYTLIITLLLSWLYTKYAKKIF